MSIRPLARTAAALAAVVVLAGCGEKEEELGSATTSEPGAEIVGDWTGELTQAGLKPFRVAVRITDPLAGEAATVAYTGINCAGTWKSLGPAVVGTPGYRFLETIDSGAGGNCKGTGNVTLAPEPGTEGLIYTFTGGGVQSGGVLTPTDAAGIAPVFQQAGVAPPP
jgi:hypothetical protein